GFDEVCIDGPGPDLTVWEVGPAVEPYAVSVGQDGSSTPVGTDDGSVGTFDLAGSGASHFTSVTITALGDASGNTTGADIDAVECLYAATHLVTGGGQITSGRRVRWSFGGNAGQTTGGAVGQLQIVDHANRVSCHFDVIEDLAFSGGEAESPDASADTASFDAVGACTDGTDPASVHVVIHDGSESGRTADTVEVSGRFTFSGVLSGGNFQVHES
ncbi:MAG TPA: post-COAP-1 domain-containing protein, partial [Acidimicrobiales bacterium]|nr:post-COAP-1 domain-containing protein [Acidimicrobiales bacterium]